MNPAEQSKLIKVAIVGPECTGKTDLSKFLAEHYHTEWVPEYARGFLDNLTRPYKKEDLLTIAHGQQRIENEWTHFTKNILICDTTLLVIKVWSEFKFGECDPEIVKNVQESKYDVTLLTYVDVPWEDDPQREQPNKREELYSIYKKELTALDTSFTEIKGEKETRRQLAVEAIESFLKNGTR
ncbi:MAG: ATP-binding protein [Flammeovirgaceae bacterium]|nr:ATP-binding protein [Flammeovirgaceae bacterium]